MTKVEMFNEILANDSLSDEQKQFLEKERDAVEKRNAHRSSTPTKKQKENEELKGKILEYLGTVEGATATEVATALGVTVQKASALLRQLYKDGADDRKVDKAKDKKVTKFSLMQSSLTTEYRKAP